MRKVNVLFIIPTMGIGGSERLVHNLLLRLDRDRFNPSLAWLNDAEAIQEFRSLQVPLHCVPKTKRFDFAAMRKLATIVESESIDVVNAQHFMPTIYAYYGCKLAGNKALIYTAHSRWEIEETSLKWRVAGSYVLRGLDRTIGIAPDVSRAIQQVFRTPKAKTLTIENGVDTDLLVREKDVRRLRSSLGLAGGENVVGVVANLKTVKNHLFLLKAFAKVVDEIDNVKLLIVGQGFADESDNTEADLRQFVNQHRISDKVLFLGYRKDIADLLGIMDIFCLPSVREGLPLGLIEAMAARVPVVGTNVEGIRDVVTPQTDGMLVEPGDVTALRDALAGLLKDPEMRQRLGAAGRDKAVQRYSLHRCVREYEQLFLSLANTRADRQA